MKNSNSFHIGLRIKELREKAGLTQEDLARLIGYKSRSTINKIEMGKNDIPQSKIEKFAAALGVPPIVLMGWDVPEFTDSTITSAGATLHQCRTDNPTLFELQRLILTMDSGTLEELLKYAKFLNSK